MLSRLFKTFLSAISLCALVPLVCALELRPGTPVHERIESNDFALVESLGEGELGPEGIMFFGGPFGLFEYDGARWRQNRSVTGTVMKLAMGDDGYLYVGKDDDFGRMEVSAEGELVYRSLWRKRDDQFAGNRYFLIMQPTEQGLFAGTPERLFRVDWETEAVELVHEASYVHAVIGVGERVFVSADADGKWFEYFNGELEPAPASPEVHAGDPIARAARLPDGRWMLLTFSSGMYLFDGDIMEPLARDERLWGPEVVRSVSMQAVGDDRVAIATADNGLFLVGLDGSVHEHYSYEGSVLASAATDLAVDQQGGLWVVTETDVTRIDSLLDAEVYGPQDGLSGVVRSILQHENTLYVGTSRGLFRSAGPEDKVVESFVALDRDHGRARSMISVGSELLVAFDSHIAVIEGGQEVATLPYSVDQFLTSERRPGVVFITGYRTVGSLERIDGVWRPISVDTNFAGQIYGMAMDEQGYLWLSGGTGTMYAANANARELVFRRFGMDQGLSGSGWNVAVVFGSEVRVVEDSALLRFDRFADRFVPDDSITYFGRTTLSLYPNEATTQAGDRWVSCASGAMTLFPPGNHEAALHFLGVHQNQRAQSIAAANDGSVFIGTHRGMARIKRFDPLRGDGMTVKLRRVYDLRHDETLYGGFGPTPQALLDLRSDQNSLRLDFAINNYRFTRFDEVLVAFSGFDGTGFTNFQQEATRDVTNLAPGSHTLTYLARSYTGSTDGSSIGFQITPPWYAAWWAYSVYAALAGLGVWGIGYWRYRSLNQANQALERQVDQRTAELAEQALLLAGKNDELTDALQRAEMLAEKAGAADVAKSQFLANMSHEIRTPMNGILGMCSILKRTPLEEDQQDYLTTIQSSSETLLRLINDILDFSKIEAGKLELEILPFDLTQCVEDVVELLGHGAAMRGLSMYLNFDYDVPLRRLGDPTRLRQVLVNLVGNAIKFTRDGSVSVRVRNVPGSSGRLRFEVQDTGVGIAEDKISLLFQPFSQADNSMVREFGGTGLGLSICRRLIEQMGGAIWVESVLNEGSTFIFEAELPVVENFANATLGERLRPCLPAGTRIAVYSADTHLQYQIRSGLESIGGQGLGIAKRSELIAAIRPGIDLLVIDCDVTGAKTKDLVFACRGCRAGFAALPILLLSSKRDPALAEFARQEVAIEMANKPLRPSKLVSFFATLLGLESAESSPRNVTTDDLRRERAISSLRVLLVEDNYTNQQVLLKMLDCLGVKATLASDGVEGVAAALRDTYDLVFMDLQLPLKDGYAASAEILGQLGPRAPMIYAISANVYRENIQRCTESGMSGFISKPVAIEELEMVLRGVAARLAGASGP